ncbi:MAG TPA: hypothetical protein PL110_17505 [Candidatus Eremiobacteraeota bacterium]|nr:MAG: hypothetical protein BWY64_00731 [bacterium ADurb.Bin363]HPZ09892.1 hypothetical protein [Candidatus Eremiobacteraeota bacterium]
MTNKIGIKVLKDDDFELLKGQKIENYLQFLSCEGYNIKREELEGLRMDATGFSPDLAKQLGEDYLHGYIVITTVNQRDDVIIRDDYSCLRPFINFIYSNSEVFNLINDITLKEVLIGKLTCYYDRMFRRLFVELNLDTPGKSIRRIREIKKEIATLRADPYRMLSKARTEKLKKIAVEPYDLSQRFPTLDLVRIPEGNLLPLRKQVECLREAKPEGDVFYFVGQRNIIIYFSNVKPSVYLGDDVDIFLQGNNRNQILNILFRHGFIGFKEDLTNTKLEEIARESIISTITTSSFLTGLETETEIPAVQITAKLNEYKVIRNKITKDINQNNILFRDLDFAIKKDLVEPKRNRIDIQELLSKIEPENLIKMYLHDNRRFKQHFSSARDEEKVSILGKLISYLRQSNQSNLIVNTWLAENHFKICKECGIRFVM